MDSISPKVKLWIDNGKDPRSAHWQGGLEAIMNSFMPLLEPGRLIPVGPMEEADLSVFLKALALADLSPNLYAAFLPPPIAKKLIPPDSAKELQHIEKNKPSYKILILRPGDDERVFCAEISEQANNPGFDIFQSGALLGTYNFENQEDCFAQLAKTLRTHIWEKGKWRTEDYNRYTLNWFEKVINLKKGTVEVEKNVSYFHSPTLIKSNSIDVIFTLIYEMVEKRLNDSEDPLQEAVAVLRNLDDAEIKKMQISDLTDKIMFEYLTAFKNFELVLFDEFSDREMEAFNKASAATNRQIVSRLSSAVNS